MRVALWTSVAVLVAASAGCGGDDESASDDAPAGGQASSGDLVGCLEAGGFKKGSLPVGATEVEGAENVGEFVIPGTTDDFLIVYETASEADAEAKASAYFGTGITGAAAVGKRFYAYTSDTPPVQPEIEGCLSA